jgi:protein-S-isoprenylcysteine O-methyltransferase Ste14
MGTKTQQGETKAPKENSSLLGFVLVTLVTVLFISQIILGIILMSDVSQIEVLAYAGVGLYVLSGLVFGWLPVIEFRKRGRVESGKSYIHTTQLVDTGIFSIVRHPQYVTFMLWAIAGMLLFQHCTVVLLGIPVLPLTYIDLIRADKDAIEKFGDEYKAYMRRVPRANFLLGIIRRYKED